MGNLNNALGDMQEIDIKGADILKVVRKNLYPNFKAVSRVKQRF